VTAALERRYRRLLALYPAAHRDEYGEEMLAVLLARARPGQRRPGLGEALDLARCALAARVGRWAGGLADERWRDAAAVTAVVTPMMLVGLRLSATVADLGISARIGAPIGLPLTLAAWVAAWLGVVLSLACGMRLVAAALAWLVVLGQAVALGRDYATSPDGFVYGTRSLVVAVIAAAAASVPAPRRHGLRLLGRTGTAVAAGAAVAFACGGLLDLPFVTVTHLGDGSVGYAAPGGFTFPIGVLRATPVSQYTALLQLCAAVAVLVVIVRLGAPLRRRVAALLLPAVASYLLIRLTFGGFLASSPRFYPTPVLLVWPQWVALVATPVLAFVVGAAAVQRAERRDRLMALGREREQELGGPGPGE
jgi:hypothetical protein